MCVVNISAGSPQHLDQKGAQRAQLAQRMVTGHMAVGLFPPWARSSLPTARMPEGPPNKVLRTRCFVATEPGGDRQSRHWAEPRPKWTVTTLHAGPNPPELRFNPTGRVRPPPGPKLKLIETDLALAVLQAFVLHTSLPLLRAQQPASCLAFVKLRNNCRYAAPGGGTWRDRCDEITTNWSNSWMRRDHNELAESMASWPTRRRFDATLVETAFWIPLSS